MDNVCTVRTSASASADPGAPPSTALSAAVSVGGASVATSSGLVSVGGRTSEVSFDGTSLVFCSVAATAGCSLSVGVGMGGVGGAVAWRSFSRFFSSVRRKAFKVVRSALFGLQRSGETGVCAHTGQVSEREAWPREMSRQPSHKLESPRPAARTGLADRLIATRQAEGVNRQLAADGTS